MKRQNRVRRPHGEQRLQSDRAGRHQHESWEKAAKVERAAKSLRDLRVAEVVEQDLVIEKGKVSAYRTKVKLSFKYGGGS
jgi:flavin-binding protein dodecin